MIEAGGFVSCDLHSCFRSLVVADEKGRTERWKAAVIGWKDLPMELLLRIVSLTDDRTTLVASGVCTGWRGAVCAGLTHLSLSWCKKNMSHLLQSLAPKFTKLQVLILRQSGPQLEDAAVEAVASFCHDLLELDLSNSLKLRDESLYALANGCPRLARLNISGCSAFSDAALSYLTSRCRSLQSLNLCGCVKAASDKALQAIASSCSRLQHLNLGWCEGVGDDGVISLASGCPDLRAVDLCGCVLITDASVVALAEGCWRLRSLGLYFCQNITDRAMYSLAKVGRRKRELEEEEEEEKGKGKEKGKEKEGLERLNISQCTALTPAAVQEVCDSFPGLHTCSGRHSLIISGCLRLTSVHCACAVQARHRSRGGVAFSRRAY
ncbi:unnamed protein product [Spirodela intermedia]|uniref:F-box/LRR-repeat protein 15-like leucin rich repeat domain-containing protein n=1 Tax=Spirodela intermedia TaxID=51605 RepID=A0A7I8L582_SPIIN|nr:unnamed protein product [Spirodela intermedia]